MSPMSRKEGDFIALKISYRNFSRGITKGGSDAFFFGSPEEPPFGINQFRRSLQA